MALLGPILDELRQLLLKPGVCVLFVWGGSDSVRTQKVVAVHGRLSLSFLRALGQKGRGHQSSKFQECCRLLLLGLCGRDPGHVHRALGVCGSLLPVTPWPLCAHVVVFFARLVWATQSVWVVIGIQWCPSCCICCTSCVLLTRPGPA